MFRYGWAKPIVTLGFLCLSSCMQSYYTFWEALGQDKPDLLKDQVDKLREDQHAVTAQLQDALTRLKTAYGSSGSQLETTYENLKDDYEQAEKRNHALRQRIVRVGRIGDDLFDEWDTEIQTLHNPTYKADSNAKLTAARRKFQDLRRSLAKAEQGIEPVMTQFHDQVIYLKHNLNAAALGTLRGEARTIEADIGRLVQDMQRAIAASNEFLGTLDQSALAH